MSSVAAIGDINEDLLMEVDRLPGPDLQVVARRATPSGGGSAANFAAACARLGLTTSLYAALGDDHRGRWLRDLVAGMGVDARGVQVLAEVPTGVTVSLSHGGLRTMFSYPGTNLDYVGEGFEATTVKVEWVHITSYFLLHGLRPRMVEAARTLARRGVRVSFDPGWHHGDLTAADLLRLNEILPYLELFTPNLREARAYLAAPRAGAARLARLGVEAGAKVCCVHLGAGGCATCEGDEVVEVPAFRVPVVESTGAGDVFAAGFAAARLAGRCLEKSTRHACAAAALSLRGPGWDAYPAAVDVEAMLSGRVPRGGDDR